MSSPVRLSSTPGSLRAAVDADFDDLGVRAVGAEKVSGHLSSEVMIGV